ncbi:hypothetical protein [Vulcanococcus sp.]|uniref:hypothetical protein n=1 Tax=Vulcanococcus sp. TaxID=2856995 RepID=UPI003F6A12B4
MAQRVNLFLDDGFAEDIKAKKPKSLSLSAFCALLIEQALDSACTLGVPSASEGTTSNSSTLKKPSIDKSINGAIEQHKDLIRQFWKVKKGSKGDVAWKLLQTELGKLQDAYGDAVVAEQLQLAINGKWAGVSAARYEQFKPQGKAVTPPPRRKKTEAEIQAEEEAAHQKRLREMGLI